MKQIILLLFIALLANKVHARKGIPIPVCFPCEEISLVKDLPDDEELKQGNSFLNLGYIYEGYGVLFVRAWNKKGRYVLTNKEKTVYYEIDENQLEGIKQKYNLELSSNPISFWKKIGGKLIYMIIIGLIIYSKFFSKDEDEEDVATE